MSNTVICRESRLKKITTKLSPVAYMSDQDHESVSTIYFYWISIFSGQVSRYFFRRYFFLSDSYRNVLYLRLFELLNCLLTFYSFSRKSVLSSVTALLALPTGPNEVDFISFAYRTWLPGSDSLCLLICDRLLLSAGQRHDCYVTMVTWLFARNNRL